MLGFGCRRVHLLPENVWYGVKRFRAWLET
jgi:hypothetical protein